MKQDMSNAEQDIRSSLKEELQHKKFPLNNPMELSAALSNGENTVISMGESAVRATEIGIGMSEQLDYPYRSAADFVADVVEVLKEADRL